MRRFPVIATPSPDPLFLVDDGEVAVVAVEVEPSEVVVHFCVLVGDHRAEEEAHGRALEEWAAAGAEGHPPLDPAERRFRGVSISVSDDRGGTYRWRTSVIGGSGHFFNAEYCFAGELADDAARLVVEATTESGDRASVRISV
jgi:hypothetical protein